MSKQTIRHTSGSRSHLSVIVVAASVLVFLGVWVGGVLLMRAASSVAKLSDSLGQNLSVVRGDDLIDRVGTQGSFPAWRASSGTNYAGTIYVLNLENNDPTLLQRILLAPRVLRIAVSVDPAHVVKELVPVLPRHPALPKTLFEQWKGIRLYQLIGADQTSFHTRGGVLGGPMNQAMTNLASSMYVAELGEDAFSRLVAQRQSLGSTPTKSFPVFQATTTEGRAIGLSDLRGKNTVIVFTQPTCGSCYQATMDVIKAVRERKLDWNIVAVIQGTRGVAPVDRYVQEATDCGAVVIVDADQSIARQMRQTRAPYAVLLDADTGVRYSGDAYTGIYKLMDELSQEAGS